MTIKLLNASPASSAVAERSYRIDTLPPPELIRDAIVLPGDRTLVSGTERYTGGVHRADGAVVAASLLRRADGWSMIPRAPAELRRQPAEVETREAVYAGILIHHYGHFTLESTARLWWVVEQGFAGPIVFQATYPDLMRNSYMTDFFDLLGIRDRIVFVDRPLRFARLIVPPAALEIRGHIHRSFLAPFRAITARLAVTAGSAGRHRPRRLYLSRTQLKSGISIGEDAIEQRFRAEGYHVLHPETVPLAEQIVLLNGADRIAGLTGSALHNLLYCGPKQVCYINRTQVLNANYPMLDQVLGTSALYVMGTKKPRTQPGRGNVYLLDPEIVCRELEAEGWLSPKSARPAPPKDLRRHVMAELELQAAIAPPAPGASALPAGRKLRHLLLAAALRPGDKRTLKVLVAELIARGRFQIADRFARELLSRSQWRADLATDLAAQFTLAGKPALGDALQRRAAEKRAGLPEQRPLARRSGAA